MTVYSGVLRNVNRWVQIFNEKLLKSMAVIRFLGKSIGCIWTFLKTPSLELQFPKLNASKEIPVNCVFKNPVWKQSTSEQGVL